MKPSDLRQYFPRQKRRVEIDWSAFWTVIWLALILLLAYALVAENDAAAAAQIAASTANSRADTVETMLTHCANGHAVGLGGDAIMTCRIAGLM